MSSQLLRALTSWAGHLAPGLQRRTTFRDGELELELTLQVRRAPALETIERYRAAALEVLGGERHWLVRHCGCRLKARGLYSRYERDCTGAVVAAVVYRADHLAEAPGFLFVCHRHRAKHGVEPKNVLAVVELPRQELAELRKRSEVEHAKWLAKCDAEDKAREADERKAATS